MQLSLLFVVFLFHTNRRCLPTPAKQNDGILLKFQQIPKMNSNVCADKDSRCNYWASSGECFVNPAWMIRNCRQSCQACQGEKAWELRKHLLTQYNNSLHDNDQKGNFKRVTIHMINVNHMEIDELEQMIKIHGTLMMAWNDSRVKWDNQQWEVSWLNLVWSEIWIPQLVSVFTLPKKVRMSEFANKAVALHHSGQVFVWVDFMMQTFALMDYARYPFDEQTACFRFSDLRDFNVQFAVDASAAQALRAAADANRPRPAGWRVTTMEAFEEKQQQQLIVSETDDLADVSTSAVDVCVTIQRDTAYIGATYLAPCLTTTLITLISMLMPYQLNKISLIVASLALQTLFLSTLESKLPPATGKTPMFVKFCSCNMAITCFVLLLELILCSMEGMKTTLPPPRWIIIAASRLSNALPNLTNGANEVNEVKLQEDHRGVSDIVDLSASTNSRNLWTPVLRSIRFIAFIFAIAFYFLLFMITFVF